MIGYLKEAMKNEGKEKKWVYSKLAIGFVEVLEEIPQEDKFSNTLELKLNKDGVYETKNGRI
jgi:hypothetical protein